MAAQGRGGYAQNPPHSIAEDDGDLIDPDDGMSSIYLPTYLSLPSPPLPLPLTNPSQPPSTTSTTPSKTPPPPNAPP